MLRAPTGGSPEPVAVFQVTETGCIIESSRPLELGVHVQIEVDGVVAAGVVTSSNELQLVYGIQFSGKPEGSAALVPALGEFDEGAGD